MKVTLNKPNRAAGNSRNRLFELKADRAWFGTFASLKWGMTILGVMAWTAFAQAAVWYVDSSVSGTHNGTSWATAWLNLTSVSGVSAGDTVYISGGPSGSTNSYSLSGWSPAGGSPGNPITYQIGQDSSHNGTALFVGSGNFLSSTAPNYVSILGYVTNDAAMHFALSGYTGIWTTDGTVTGFRFAYVNFGNFAIANASEAFFFGSGTSGLELDHLYCYVSSLGPNFFFNVAGCVTNSTSVTGSSVKLHHITLYLPKYGSSSPAYGCDGLDGAGDGAMIYNNYIASINTHGAYTYTQHQDGVQWLGGNNLVLSNNVFVNLGNSGIYIETWDNTDNLKIVNNTCILTDGYGDFGLYVTDGEEPSAPILHNAILANNTIDGGGANGWGIIYYQGSGGGGFSGCLLANNARINNGTGAAPTLESYGGATGFTSIGNVNLTASQAAGWFISYTAGATNNNYGLTSSATGLIGTGVNESSYFNMDAAGNARPAAGAWDVGAYNHSGSNTNPVIAVSPSILTFGSVVTNTGVNLSFTVQNAGGGILAGTASVAAPFSIVAGGTYSLGANQSQSVTVRFSPNSLGLVNSTVTFTGGGGATGAVSGTGTSNLPPQVSAVTQTGADVDPNAPGLQIYSGSVVQYSGSASDPNSLSLTWQWIYTVNDGPEIVALSGTGTVASVSFNYTPSTAGNTYVWKLRVSDGIATAESDLTVGVEAPPVAGAGLVLQASSGVLTAPFVLASGSVSQAISTGVTNGGTATYMFSVTNAGAYVVQLLVNATDLSANSLYVNIDGVPQDPEMIFDIPVTSGFEERIVSWRGNGTADANQFVPEVFNLTQGVHQLLIVGREANVQIEQLSILQLPLPPQNLRIVSNP
jgi:hypothetical protein